MPKRLLIKLVLAVVVTLTVGGVGYVGLMVWRNASETEVPGDEELIGDTESAVEPSFLSESDILQIDTTTWSTYRNTEFGYEIQYPERYHISDGPKYARVVSFGETFEYNIFITVSEEPMALGFRGTWGPILQSETDQRITSSEEVRINGVPFTKNYWSEGPTTLTAYTTHGEEVYTLSFALKPENEEEAAIFDQILSTFRLID